MITELENITGGTANILYKSSTERKLYMGKGSGLSFDLGNVDTQNCVEPPVLQTSHTI
jgi:hypothetical protein